MLHNPLLGQVRKCGDCSNSELEGGICTRFWLLLDFGGCLRISIFQFFFISAAVCIFARLLYKFSSKLGHIVLDLLLFSFLVLKSKS